MLRFCPRLLCVLLAAISELVLLCSARGGAVRPRETNTTLRFPISDPAAGPQYRTVEALNGMAFEKPVFVTSPPGETNRLFVVERAGRIVVITNLAQPTRTIFLDISSEVAADWETQKMEGLSSVAFHPGYLTNRFPFFYLTYTLRQQGSLGTSNYNRLSRFQSTRGNPNEASPSTEVPLITQIDHGDGHNFNHALFGPDGYLYVSVGDEGDGGKGDDFNNAQKIDKNFFSGILRLDVDRRPDSLPPNPHPASSSNYSIPADNPWVGATNFNGLEIDPTTVRTEFYAVGLRNPWRIWFDPETGLLYEGDVGQHGREEINLIVKGANYGWSFWEGSLPGPKKDAPPGVSFQEPIYQYSPGYGPNQGFCVTGGIVYRGPSLPELVGSYVFADYVSGNIWSFRYDGTNATGFQRIASHAGIASFGVDPSTREMLLVDHDKGKILKLERTNSTPVLNLPPTLAETGAFADLTSLAPNPGILPYEVNHPFWSDGSAKRRWFSLPQASIGFAAATNWTFPTGSIWIKQFDLTNALSDSPRRLETRFLVKTEAGVYGATYRWTSPANATLVPEEGMDEPILVMDQGIVRTQIWHYPSRTECLACHTPSGGYALGFNTAQLNRDVVFGTNVVNQLLAMNAMGCFGTNISNVGVLPALAPLSDEGISREYRVRSYLAANCAFCHQPGTSVHALWDGRLTTPLGKAGILDGRLYESGADSSNRVVTAGSLEHSSLYHRLANPGKDHMPPLATSVINTEAVDLLRDWILQDLPSTQQYSEWQKAIFPADNSAQSGPAADPDGDGASNYLEYLTGTNPLSRADVWTIQIERTQDSVALLFPQAANRLYEVQFTDDLWSPWRPLDSIENRPFASATNRITIVHDSTLNGTSRLYRICVNEP